MLDADYLFNVADEIVELYEQLNIFGINDICRRLVNAEFQLTGSAEWQYYILQQTGMSREEINKQIAQITKKSEVEIKAIFEEASYQSYNADMSVYEKAGLTTLPFSQSERMLSILDATYRATLGELHNLTMTTADASQELLINTLNETQWKVATGMQSKNQAVAEAVEKVASDGINVMYGEGVRRSIESVVRMCVTTGINQACSQISLQNCESMGTDLVLTSSHPGARTGDGYKGHVNWQGRVFSLSGNSKKYPSFRDACGFGQALGICGINCRHSFLPYIDGVSHNPFERYDSGEDKAKYANQQKQRRMERDIRTTKRQLQAMQESMNATAETDVREVLQEKYDRLAYKLRNQKEKYNLFCADNNLIVQPERMKVARFNRSQAQRAAWGAKRYEGLQEGLNTEGAVPQRNIISDIINRKRASNYIDMANEINTELDEICVNKSKWSGNICVRKISEMGKKEWNCDITLSPSADYATELHELIHARSISYCDEKVYVEFQKIEEGSVELLTELICKKKNKTFIPTYEEEVKHLLRVNRRSKMYVEDFDFAKELINIEVPERLEWLISKAHKQYENGIISEKELDSIYDSITKLIGGY